MKTLTDLLKSKRTVKLVSGIDHSGNRVTIPVMGLVPSKKKNKRGVSDFDSLIGLRDDTTVIVPVSQIDFQHYPLIVVECEQFYRGINY